MRTLGSGPLVLVKTRSALRVLSVVTGLAIATAAAPFAVSAAPADRAVVVSGDSAAAAARAVRAVGGTVGAELDLVGGAAARVSSRDVTTLRRAGFHVVDDVEMQVNETTAQNVPVADLQHVSVNPGGDWDLDAGAGVGVALVDTGVTVVPDLEGRVVHGLNLSGEPTERDTYGHGTFMAGLIAGDGTSSAAGPVRHVGVAPGAHIVSVKVAGADGSTSLSKVINGIGWAVENADTYAIRVLNLSLSAPRVGGNYNADPLSGAVEAAWSAGITVVTSSGNDGGAVASPARDPWIITVGALATGASAGPEDDTVPSWSSREVLKYGSKPELLAPGVSVISLAAPGSAAVAKNPGSVVDGSYFRGSGTSMSAAMTSGAVAVLSEHHAAATPDDFKAALVRSGRAVPGQIGVGIDLARADLLDPSALTGAWPQMPIAFDGLDGRLGDRMPWAAEAGTPWANTRWAGTRWANTRWAERAWHGNTYADVDAASTRWSNTRWASTRWAGTGSAGDTWASTRWSSDLWSNTRWSSTRWANTRWSGGTWSSTRWSGAKWSGAEWDSTRWSSGGWTMASSGG